MASKQTLSLYRYWYTQLLRLYPKPYLERFGEAMTQTFNDLLSERQVEKKKLFTYTLWMFVDTSVGIIKENILFITMQNKSIIRLALFTACLLLIPVFGNMYIDGWNWSPFDFVFAGTLIFGTGLIYELVASRGSFGIYRAAVGLSLLTMFLLVWVNAAVGIIGDGENPTRPLYLGVVMVLFLGSVIARFRPHAMTKVLFITAFAHVLVPVIAFFAWRPLFNAPPGVARVFLLNAFFVLLWVGAGLLFRRAAVARG